MSTLTSRLGLYKPAASGVELVNVVTDLNNNLDSIDAKIGAFPCTSGTRPGSPFDGQMIRETDTGRIYIWAANVSQWRQVLFHAASFGQNIVTTAKLQSTGSGGGLIVDDLSTASSIAINSNVVGDTNDRVRMYASGLLEWGPGNASSDTNLYRGGTSLLKTDDAFQAVGNLTIGGSSSLAALSLSGNLTLSSGGVYRNQMGGPFNHNNSTGEQAIATMSIPANDGVIGAVYRLHAWGTLTVTGTPTITFRLRLAAAAALLIAAPAITVRSGATDGQWEADCYVMVGSTGVAGTWAPKFKIQHNFLTSATTWTPLGPLTSAPVTQDTTVANTLTLTAQWSAASASNSCNLRGYVAERVA